MPKPKLLVILGPTAVGKSGLAVAIAKKLNGEIISADSRQVYRGLDVGSGKITEREMQGIPHHLLNVVDPDNSFTVVDFKQHAEKAITDILSRRHVPIIVGGTGMYIQSIIDNVTFPIVPKDAKLREKLSEKTSEELFALLEDKDPERAKTIDSHNTRRLIRALEIIEHLGHVPPKKTGFPSNYTESPYDVVQIGLDASDVILKSNIKNRTEARLKNGFIEEVEALITQGISRKRISEFGLGYRCVSEALTTGGKNSAELAECIEQSEWHYAKRQRTWFKRDSRIVWFDPRQRQDIFELLDKTF